MKPLFPCIFALTAFMLCANFGSNSSTEGRAKPRISFYGTLTPSDGTKYPVKNILIGGLYEHIPFFAIPATENSTPSNDTTYLDLDNIDSIRPAFTLAKDSLRTYKNRDYLEIVVTLKKTSGKEPGSSERHFLVDASRKLFCDQVTIAGDLEKEILFEAVQELTVLGFRPGEKNKGSTDTKDKSAAKEALCTETKKNLAELEAESKGLFPDLIKKIKESVNYICGY
ncbi:TPA: hypothetical protein DDZ86_00445 [Candidatus Dependentiae bacterium]|nr:MAG: hypothetical protein UW09_C0002G0033 [candidate division TM6 bacterium GW2011_GWF2_43_87]HBL98098.1 hypothetical protein [Candidatus Dependentiae bacterium]